MVRFRRTRAQLRRTDMTMVDVCIQRSGYRRNGVCVDQSGNTLDERVGRASHHEGHRWYSRPRHSLLVTKERRKWSAPEPSWVWTKSEHEKTGPDNMEDPLSEATKTVTAAIKRKTCCTASKSATNTSTRKPQKSQEEQHPHQKEKKSWILPGYDPIPLLERDLTEESRQAVRQDLESQISAKAGPHQDVHHDGQPQSSATTSLGEGLVMHEEPPGRNGGSTSSVGARPDSVTHVKRHLVADGHLDGPTPAF